MPKAACPVCGKNVPLNDDEAVLYERVICPHCDASLEVTDEDPVMLDEVMDE